MTVLWLLLVAGVSVGLAYRQASLGQSTLVGVILLSPVLLLPGVWLPWRVLTLLALLTLGVLNVNALRRALLSKPALRRYRSAMPAVSATERQALEAGTVWWEGELFAGQPNWDRLLGCPRVRLDEDERAFLDGPVSELCAMLDDWEITHVEGDLPPTVWEYLKNNGFFGLIIPKRYGGLEFSAWGHSCVLAKIAARSITAASTVAVPNSLGPAELLLEYGTDAQREHYLPRLASGQEVPCFALTSAEAGSDATAITDIGVLCYDFHEGEEVLGIRLDFAKRYITLAPIATVIALAFKLRDPENLLGGAVELGITVALIPVSTPGVRTGRRHFPLNNPFQNGPVLGERVFIPVDYIVGGAERAGDGWRMLVECLTAGRSISLPANATGGARAALAASSAYAALRRQFGRPIAEFEGIKAPLARIAGNAYLMEAANRMTLAAIDLGEAPAVASAIMKYHITELGRQVANDAMDIHGGKAIMLGPKNYLGRGYQSVPVMITVEGANILTRSMIIFGQGALRCHPWLAKEMRAAAGNPEEQSEGDAVRFDQALLGHLGHTLTTAARAFVDGATRARWVPTPGEGGVRRYYQHTTRMSAALAFATEVALSTYQGRLKRHEAVSARLGDVLSALYLTSAALKRFEDEGSPEEDLPVVRWCCETQLSRAQGALAALVSNLPGRAIRALAQLVLLPGGRDLRPPSDALTHRVAELMTTYSSTRLRIVEGTYLAREAHNPIGLLDGLLEELDALTHLQERLRTAIREGRVAKGEGSKWTDQVTAAGRAGVLEASEVRTLTEHAERVSELLAVDDFDSYELGTRRKRPVKGPRGSRSVAGT
ncbi:MAG: acyl-CoA dehydrogenase [Pseudomonadota bacterium]